MKYKKQQNGTLVLGTLVLFAVLKNARRGYKNLYILNIYKFNNIYTYRIIYHLLPPPPFSMGK